MKKIRIQEDGKQFEAYLKLAITVQSGATKELHGVSYAGSNTACRAIHAALYSNVTIEIVDEDTNSVEIVRSTQSYRRVEEVDGKVNHTFCMPRSALSEDYQNAVADAVKNQSKFMPERVVMAPKGNIYEVVGNFISETYGLPKTNTWRDKYLTILGIENITKLDVEATPLASDWTNCKAVKISSMTEDDVLDKINEAIQLGQLVVPDNSIMGKGRFEEGWSTEEYLRNNSEILASKLDAVMKPLYDGNSFVSYLGETNRVCVPAQARVVMASLNVLKEKQGVFIVGDMGTGKTQMSLSTVYSYARQREDSGATHGMLCLIVAPSNVVPKWANSEIPKVLGKNNVITRIITCTEDALAYVNQVKNDYKVPRGKIEFVLVSTDRMKLSAQGFVLGAKWNASQMIWQSPNTGEALITPKMKKDDIEEDCIAGWSDAVKEPPLPPTSEEIHKAKEKGMLGANGLPYGYVKKWQSEVRAFQDSYEGKADRSLARPALKKYGEGKGKPRWLIAQIFQRQLRNHFHMGIYDEIHQMKASDSGRGAAFAKILKSCRKSIFLTGTLTNGASSSIQAILWRAFPGDLIAEGIKHNTSQEQWASRYGVLEKVVTRNEDTVTVGATSNRKKNNVTIKEKPGVAPQMVANYLLDKSVFLDLAEMQVPLVELKEEPIIVELDDDHIYQYKRLHSDLFNTCQKLQREIGSGAWARFNPTTINYADQPNLGANVTWVDKDGSLLGNVSAPSFPHDDLNAKERKLVELVHQELKQKRRVVVYTNYTGEYQTNERLKHILSEKGIEAEVLDDKVSTSKRFDWLEQQAKAGTEVIITNARLVEVGLDCATRSC